MLEKTEPTVAEKTGKNVIVVDTNVLINDPGAIAELRKGGNLLVIPWTVVMELDKLKKTPGIKLEVMEAIREIDRLCEVKDPSLIIEQGKHFSKLDLDKSNPDHQIIATLNYVLHHFSRQRASHQHNRYSGYDKVKMITNDYTVKILARKTDQKEKPIVEPYLKTRLDIKRQDLIIPTVNVNAEDVLTEDKTKGIYTFRAKGATLKKIPNGEAVIVGSDFSPLAGRKIDDWKKEGFAAVRKGDKFQIINPNIEASGIKAMHNSHQNWAQIIALYYLLDYTVNCVFLQGGAGTGKTLLALAASLGQRKSRSYNQIIISRPAVPLDVEQQIGYLPGDIRQKLNPWLLPIIQNLRFILKDEEKPKIKSYTIVPEIDILDENGITIQSLDFIRGATFSNAFIIIDEAQNLTRHQIKTIVTRVGEGSKIVFTGDLSQIDNRHLDRSTSGLAYAIQKMKGYPMVGTVNFKETLRSKIASLAEEVL